MQHHTDTGHPPGTVALAAGMQPRFYEFTQSLERLQVPAGTTLNIRRSCDVAQNFNNTVKTMTGEWIWFLGDDHSFAPDTLLKLLNYNVDVVVPISPIKVAPYAPCVIHRPDDPTVLWDDNMPLYTWEELSGEGLFALPKGDFIGQAGMLVKKHVLDRMGYPWFKTGQFDPGKLQEDLWFCRELQNLGYTIWVDRDTIFDHWFFVGITARKHEGFYVPALKTGAMTMVLPECQPNRPGTNAKYIVARRPE